MIRLVGDFGVRQLVTPERELGELKLSAIRPKYRFAQRLLNRVGRRRQRTHLGPNLRDGPRFCARSSSGLLDLLLHSLRLYTLRLYSSLLGRNLRRLLVCFQLRS
ncbi:hypothetical protein [Gryllotalpicola sp.]|uniref:hypothetical protein n=1 Tax=Gryllotalpicola sp. TaxID=1932787 RepID=UPI00261D55CE|nr:hypothetical protein [Gryllotalpicola sp.]